MRDGTRQSSDAELTGGPGGSPGGSAVRVRPADPEQDTSERITLSEFLWTGPTGDQPVILVSREWLQ